MQIAQYFHKIIQDVYTNFYASQAKLLNLAHCYSTASAIWCQLAESVLPSGYSSLHGANYILNEVNSSESFDIWREFLSLDVLDIF